jgi:hypothetical protein
MAVSISGLKQSTNLAYKSTFSVLLVIKVSTIRGMVLAVTGKATAISIINKQTQNTLTAKLILFFI